MKTSTLPVDAGRIGKVTAVSIPGDILDELKVELNLNSLDAKFLQEAAEQLRSSNVPVAFPTETVYGLGADATRSSAVKGIYRAKQRPSDNPLIVHFSSLKQLRSFLSSSEPAQNGSALIVTPPDPIPDIYKPLISRFWPGPLTILLPNPAHSVLAPEVTAGLQTFGARMPKHLLALALIQLAGVPIAAPSANASTKPSPTAAEHVAYDLDGRIETIIDGGPCAVGVESTVVDGLTHPPLILRPGGVSLEQIRRCPGWEHTQVGYKNTSEAGSQPRAPGMKYRHYSPNATVILYESNQDPPSAAEIRPQVGSHARVGIVRTKSWAINSSRSLSIVRENAAEDTDGTAANAVDAEAARGFAHMLQTLQANGASQSALNRYEMEIEGSSLQILDIALGPHPADVARGIFAALRDLDREEVDAIFVEGIDDSEGDTAAAVMNRLRKAAEIRVAG